MRPKPRPSPASKSPASPSEAAPASRSEIAELPTAAQPGSAKDRRAPAGEFPADADGHAQLLCQAQNGDRAAFTEIVRSHQAAVFGYLRARLLQSSDAEDITQEVFLRCYSGRARFDPSGRVAPWLLGIARNLLHEHTRKIKRRKEVAWTELCLELDEMVSSDDALYGDMLGHLPGCLNSLGESARQAIQLRYSSHLRLAEIGEKLCRSEGAAKLLMFRARQALKNCLDRKFEAKP